MESSTDSLNMESELRRTPSRATLVDINDKQFSSGDIPQIEPASLKLDKRSSLA